MISLSDLQDDRMRAAKAGSWWEQNGQRALANNSAIYTQKPDIGQFLHEWTSLYDSHSGERGIFSLTPLIVVGVAWTTNGRMSPTPGALPSSGGPIQKRSARTPKSNVGPAVGELVPDKPNPPTTVRPPEVS